MVLECSASLCTDTLNTQPLNGWPSSSCGPCEAGAKWRRLVISLFPTTPFEHGFDVPRTTHSSKPKYPGDRLSRRSASPAGHTRSTGRVSVASFETLRYRFAPQPFFSCLLILVPRPGGLLGPPSMPWSPRTCPRFRVHTFTPKVAGFLHPIELTRSAIGGGVL